ncbi:MAG: tRNA (N(6)-L-threonylcarbamoyladenosine(37)-C(2))-methylthiotransferase MtaB [Spirochaetes bacterium]|nr:tRNA (N(6)-L-threonylcarbamoyladenosine(37)-C(2))-methylthiotransferase MtaB [Spirochaetota bacterium]
MTPLRVAVSTFGCKLNQLETESIADAFSSAGAALSSFDAMAELYVLNTCTVTGKAEQKARRSIRHASALNPGSVVIVTGCYAQMDPDGLALLSPRVIVVSGDEKTSLLELAAWLQDNWQGHGDLLDAVLEWKRGRATGSPAGAASLDRFAFHPQSFTFHSRPSLKIQDGCDNRCAYCRVCIARGPSVSLDPELALARVRQLEAAEKTEVVLTGINLSQYRWGSMRFSDLLDSLVAGTQRIRFRVSSWEPGRADEAFIAVFALNRVQPHLHLSLQSGSDSVLARMARPYTAAQIRETVKSIRSVKDDPFLAADIIAGFPGETEAEAEETFELLAELDLAYIHAFPFSARPGTRAWDMKPKVPERVAGERVARLGELARRGKAAYLCHWTGKTIPMIFEHGGEGTSANYLKLKLSGAPEGLAPGSLVQGLILGPCAESGVDGEAMYEGPAAG